MKRIKIHLFEGEESPKPSNFAEIEYTKLFIDTHEVNQDFQSYIPQLPKPIPLEFTYDRCTVFKNPERLNIEITITGSNKKYYCKLTVAQRIKLKWWFLIKWSRTTDAVKWLIPLIVSIISLVISICSYSCK